MSRSLTSIAMTVSLLALGQVARADGDASQAPPVAVAPIAPLAAAASQPSAAAAVANDAIVGDAIDDQELSAGLGLAAGGRLTPGGLELQGRFLYRLSQDDWFDGSAGFIFGGTSPGCYLDRGDQLVCDHGAVDGRGVDLSAGVRRRFAGRKGFLPFVRVAIGVRVASFAGDSVTGFAVPLTASAGLRTRVNKFVSVGAEASLNAGIGWFNQGLGAQPQFGFAVIGLVEFALH